MPGSSCPRTGGAPWRRTCSCALASTSTCLCAPEARPTWTSCRAWRAPRSPSRWLTSWSVGERPRTLPNSSSQRTSPREPCLCQQMTCLTRCTQHRIRPSRPRSLRATTTASPARALQVGRAARRSRRQVKHLRRFSILALRMASRTPRPRRAPSQLYLQLRAASRKQVVASMRPPWQQQTSSASSHTMLPTQTLALGALVPCDPKCSALYLASSHVSCPRSRPCTRGRTIMDPSANVSRLVPMPCSRWPGSLEPSTAFRGRTTIAW
mmetsp:Transcript_13166/g.35165  ORF Transcript_13166/g.35165 Transcript_13166/m.35165 type:complete len:267 (+) Transcript_13166:565-1365(+)